MKITDQDFDNAVANFGFEIAVEARKEAIAAYRCNSLAGFDQATCEAEEAAAWYAYLNDGSTDE